MIDGKGVLYVDRERGSRRAVTSTARHGDTENASQPCGEAAEQREKVKVKQGLTR